MTEKEKMLAGQMYDCGDPELMKIWNSGRTLCRNIIILIILIKKDN